MGIRIITLSENTAGQTHVLAEWGLSVLVETDAATILLDAGAGTSIIHNADKLKVDLHKVDKIVLSHGHFDHTGGLRSLLTRLQKEIEIIAHPDIWAPKYKRSKNQPDRYIGIPFQQRELESLGARFRYSRDPVNLSDIILTTGEIPLITDFEQVGSDFALSANGGWQPDPLLDDQALILKLPVGLVIILGCAHRGMINTLYHARKITSLDKIHMVLGGSHLMSSTIEQVWQAISALNEMGVQKLGLCHCTGMPASILLSQTYNKDFIFNFTGNIINL